MRINETAKEIHQAVKEKGFWDKPRNVGELLMLVTSELGEALEAHRKDRFAVGNIAVLNEVKDDNFFLAAFKQDVKDTFEDEIADAVIRLFDLAKGLNINLEAHIAAKMRFNKTRPRLHGKKY